MGKDINPELSKIRLSTHTELTRSILKNSHAIRSCKTTIKELKFDIKAVEKASKSRYKHGSVHYAKVMNTRNMKHLKIETEFIERYTIEIKELKDKSKLLMKDMNAIHKELAKKQLIHLKTLIK